MLDAKELDKNAAIGDKHKKHRQFWQK